MYFIYISSLSDSSDVITLILTLTATSASTLSHPIRAHRLGGLRLIRWTSLRDSAAGGGRLKRETTYVEGIVSDGVEWLAATFHVSVC